MVDWWMVGLVYVFFSVCLKLEACVKKMMRFFLLEDFRRKLGGESWIYQVSHQHRCELPGFCFGNFRGDEVSHSKKKPTWGLFDQSATGVMILTPTQNKLVMENFPKLSYILNCLIPPKVGTLTIPALCVDSMITSSALKNFGEKRHFLCKMNYTKMWQKLGWYCWWKKSSTTWDV